MGGLVECRGEARSGGVANWWSNGEVSWSGLSRRCGWACDTLVGAASTCAVFSLPHSLTLDRLTPVPSSNPMLPETFLKALADRARAAGVFGPVSIRDGMLVCHAKASAAPASYRVLEDKGQVWVALVMADRWLSESIESQLVENGDKVETLVREEMIDLGEASPPTIACEHFRSDDLLFTFRTPVQRVSTGSSLVDVSRAALFLLAYEAAFRQLGDMNEGGDDSE